MEPWFRAIIIYGTFEAKHTEMGAWMMILEFIQNTNCEQSSDLAQIPPLKPIWLTSRWLEVIVSQDFFCIIFLWNTCLQNAVNLWQNTQMWRGLWEIIGGTTFLQICWNPFKHQSIFWQNWYMGKWGPKLENALKGKKINRAEKRVLVGPCSARALMTSQRRDVLLRAQHSFHRMATEFRTSRRRKIPTKHTHFWTRPCIAITDKENQSHSSIEGPREDRPIRDVQRGRCSRSLNKTRPYSSRD